jgi:hypothetical protein
MMCLADRRRDQSTSGLQRNRVARCKGLPPAKARGIPTKELRALVKIRKNENKNREIYDDLEQDQQHILSMLATAEGVKDLPLWRAAAMNVASAMGQAGSTAH